MTSNSEQKNTTTTMSPRQKFDFNYVHPGATSLSVASLGVENASLSLISSPNLTGNFRPQISSAMPAIADDEGLENIEVGDDDVLEDPKTAASSNVKKTCETDGGKSSRFFMRIWSWMQSKYKLGVHRGPNRSGRRSRLRSAEFHSKKVLNAKTDELVEHTPTRNRDRFCLNKWELPQRQTSTETLTRSWADICIPSAFSAGSSIQNFQQVTPIAADHNPLSLQRRRCSYMPPTVTQPLCGERYRTGSLVQAHNQSTSLLHPLFVQSREMSLESGYISHEGGGSSRSTPSSPKKFAHFLQTKKRHSRAQLSQSASEDDGTTSPTIVTKSRILENPQQHFTIREKRQKFQKSNVFHEVIEDESPPSVTADIIEEVEEGEWNIKHEEIYFGQKIVDEPRHQISHGKWHGDIVIHTFKIKNADKKSTEIYYARAKSMMHIRHENIVSFMGASICADSIEYDVRNYSIITNPVKADSLFAKSAELPGMYGATKMSIANQVANALGYIHAKNITHGRLCSRNIFLEHKVQLSLLDYTIGQSNLVYSSPQLLQDPEHPRKTDDVFAFGTLIFEIFSGRLPLDGSGLTSEEIKKEIQNGNITKALVKFPCTEKLKQVIQACWQFEPSHRTSIAQLISNFQPGSCLVRRHSTSEPRLDQLNLSQR